MNDYKSEKVISLLNKIKSLLEWIIVWTFCLFITSCIGTITIN